MLKSWGQLPACICVVRGEWSVGIILANSTVKEKSISSVKICVTSVFYT